MFLDSGLYRPELSMEERRRRDKRTPRIAIRKYPYSAFQYMDASGYDQALLNCCGVDHLVFKQLLQLFKPAFEAHMPDRITGTIKKLKLTKHGERRGKPREINALGSLGLILFWFRTRGSSARSVALAFGLTASPMYMWLKFSRRILLSVLQDDPLAQVTEPSFAEIEEHIQAMGNKYPVLEEERVWGAADGLKIPLATSTNYVIQNIYYNDWTSSTNVNCVFVFAPDGKIRMCTLNAPGSMHDSTIADYGVYQKVASTFAQHNAKICVDSAFRLGSRDYLIKSSQQDPIDGNFRTIVLNRQATSLWQLSEHGMRMIQGQFPRSKDPMPFEERGDRKDILHLMVLLYNFQASTVGINQILNTFMSRTEGFYSYGSLSETANGLLSVV